jgi:CheY-like chemotaxis protein
MSQTILVVEDNEDNRTIYRTLLEHFGYTVLEAVDGEEGARLAEAHQPALVLMDLSMPRLDGYGALERIRASTLTAAVPVLALTAHAMEADRERATAAGFDGYLAKPIEPRLVLAEVQRIVGPAVPVG